MDHKEFNTSIFEMQELIDDRLVLLSCNLHTLFNDLEGGTELIFDRAKGFMEHHESLTNISSTLEKIDELWNRIGDDLGEEPADHTSVNKKSKLRIIRIEITEGMIRNSMLTLTRAIRNKVAKLGDEFLITLPNEDVFKTKLVSPGNRLQERKRIREFYENENILSGTEVVLIETSPMEWNLKKADKSDIDKYFANLYTKRSDVKKQEKD